MAHITDTIDSPMDESGSATTEFAIVLPAVLMILFWSLFFTDVSFVRLKAQEAARYAAWEATVFRTQSQVERDIQEHFANLRSSDRDTGTPDLLMATQINEIRISQNDEVETDMLGTFEWDFIPEIVRDLMGGASGLLNGMLDWFRFNTNGTVESSVEIEVQNTLLPTAVLALNQRIADDSINNPFVFKDTVVLTYDTWKAWPNPKSKNGNTDKNVDPYQTYPVAEKYVADQLKSVAFFGARNLGFVDTISDILGFLSKFGGPPGPLDIGSFLNDDGKGVVAMLPPDRIDKSWVPGYNQVRPYRIGQHMFDRPEKSGSGFRNMGWQRGIDRARPTVPYLIASGHWPNGGRTIRRLGLSKSPGEGGYRLRELKDDEKENNYYRTYQCRGHYYDGMIIPKGTFGPETNFGRENYDGCGDIVDTVEDMKEAFDNWNGDITQPPSIPSLPTGGFF